MTDLFNNKHTVIIICIIAIIGGVEMIYRGSKEVFDINSGVPKNMYLVRGLSLIFIGLMGLLGFLL